MCRLWFHTALVSLWTVWSVNCQGVHLDIQYDAENDDKSGVLPSEGNFGLTCKKGSRFVVSACFRVIATRLEDYDYPIQGLRPLCEFSDLYAAPKCHFVRDGKVPSKVKGGERDPCTLYYDPRLLQAEENDDTVELKSLEERRECHNFNIYKLHLDKVRMTRKNDEGSVKFTVRFNVGTFPYHSKGIQKWTFKPDPTQTDQLLKFSCDPIRHSVYFQCSDEKCETVEEVKEGNSNSLVEKVLAYVVRKADDKYLLVKGNTRNPRNVFCTVGVFAANHDVQFPRLFVKNHVNVYRTGRGKRGFRVFLKSLKVAKDY